MWRFLLLLVVVAIGSYYAARLLLEGWPRNRPQGRSQRRTHEQRRPREEYQRPLGPDDDDEFLAQISRRPEGPEEPS